LNETLREKLLGPLMTANSVKPIGLGVGLGLGIFMLMVGAFGIFKYR
jgi:hypothetical protein